MNRLSLILLLNLTFSWSFALEPTLAETAADYYGNVTSSGQDLKRELHHILNSAHVSQDGDIDRLVSQCDTKDPHCYKHISLGYKNARKYLFGQLHLEENEDGQYTIQTTYCRDYMTNSDFPGGASIGPMKIPESNIMNTEHSWPQSRFTNKFPKSMQKSDLHALFPTRSKVNSLRGSYPFGEVDSVKKAPCAGGILGYDVDSSQTQFEPADDVKGNIARALFYFSTRYDIKMNNTQEAYLRLWNMMDPVDEAEKTRHEHIYMLQHNRNPYIDKPELIDQILDF